MSSSEVIGMIEQLCVGLARTLYDRGVRPIDEKSVRINRKKLLTAAQQDDDCFRVASAIDHLFRIVMFPRRERKFSFSVDSCKGANVVYYRVVLSEFGEIRNDSGKLLNPRTAVEAAERFYYLLAWPGSTVTLLAVLDNDQIIKCGEHQLRLDAE
jgi:hypothetical protein